MFRIVLFLLILFGFAAGFAWLADNPGTIAVNWPSLNTAFDVSLLTAILAFAVATFAIMAAWWVISGIINSPKSFGRWRAGRRRDKGYEALSKGMIAAGAGNAPLAKKLAKESGKLLENEPMVAMLDAQTALLEGNNLEARKKFETMLDKPETKLLGLRGLYVEAEQEGVVEAAAHFAKEANYEAPGTPWAADAVLKTQTVSGEWEEAIRTLENNRSSGLIDKADYNRKRAVLLTALATSEEDSEPEKARTHAQAALKLAPDLVPAAVVAGRVTDRLSGKRKASKTLLKAWEANPHPEIAETYINLANGDSAKERLKRAENLMARNGETSDAKIALAKTACDAGEYKRARDAMEGVLRDNPTENACLVMADIEEAEHGDKGRVREWLSRAVTAPKDAVWVADGIASETWAPYSPVSGQLDAFTWQKPQQQLGGPSETVDYSKLVHEPVPEEESADEFKTIELVAKSAAGAAAATVVADAVAQEDVEVTVVDEKTDEIDAADVVVADSPAKDIIDDKDIGDLKPVQQGDEIRYVSDKGAKSTAPKDDDIKSSNDNASPYDNKELDEDHDGVIDRRPDDPGIAKETPVKKGRFF